MSSFRQGEPFVLVPYFHRQGRAAAVLFLLLLSTPSAADAPGEHTGQFPAHFLGVFVGDTFEDRRDGVTLGLEYEYRASERFGVGFIAEHVYGDLDVNVFVVPFALHRGPWKLYTGPGLETGHHGDKALFRVGMEYGFHLNRFEISPQVDVDFVEGGERLFVVGVVFATSF
jgi:hypothetical protein